MANELNKEWSRDFQYTYFYLCSSNDIWSKISGHLQKHDHVNLVYVSLFKLVTLVIKL